MPDKTALCWGDDSKGQSSDTPELTTFRALALGVSYTCGVRDADDEIECWGELPFDEVPVALNRRGDKYQVMRTQVEVAKKGEHKLRISGNLKHLNLFLGDQEIDIPPEGDKTDLVIDFKKSGKQNLLMVVNGTSGKGYFSMEALSDDLRVINVL